MMRCPDRNEIAMQVTLLILYASALVCALWQIGHVRLVLWLTGLSPLLVAVFSSTRRLPSLRRQLIQLGVAAEHMVQSRYHGQGCRTCRTCRTGRTGPCPTRSTCPPRPTSSPSPCALRYVLRRSNFGLFAQKSPRAACIIEKKRYL